MTMTPETDVRPASVVILRAGAIGIVIAVGLNLILYFVSTTIGALPIMSGLGQPITLAPVLNFTIGGGAVGTILYLILTRFFIRERANTIFVTIAALVLIGMSLTPITSIPEPTMATVLMLEIMHLAAGLPPMYTLTKMT
ncbi:MAG: DUF6069 family protein [Caldilineaceae bacterium]